MNALLTFQRPVHALERRGRLLDFPSSTLSLGIVALLALALLSGFLFFYHLDRRDLWSSHEARAAQDAQTMLDDGDWLLPRLYDHKIEMQKPPLYYWLVAASARIRGQSVDAWSVRLPAAAAAAGGVLTLFLFGWKRSRIVAGFVAALALATMQHYTWLGRIGRIDMPLTLAVGIALLCFFQGWSLFRHAVFPGRNTKDWVPCFRGRCGRTRAPGEEAAKACGAAMTVRMLSQFLLGSPVSPASSESMAPSDRYSSQFFGNWVPWVWFLVAYVAVAVAVLLKGPIGVALPGIVVVIFLLVERELPRPWKLGESGRFLHAYGLWWGAPLLALLVVPWFWLADSRTDGRFFQVFFWYHNLERGLGGAEQTLASHPWWFYGPRAFFDMLPWSLATPFALFWFLKKGDWRGDPEARFGVVWFAAMTGLLSFSHFKRADYLLPAYPGAALFLGCVLERWRETLYVGRISNPSAPGRTDWKSVLRCFRSEPLWAIGALSFVACPLAWWMYVDRVLPDKEPLREDRSFAEMIRQLAPRPASIIFFRVEAHALAFHVGKPIDTVLEWENLDIWASRPGCNYIVMPPDCVRDWPRHVTSGRLGELARNTDATGGQHDHPLVVLCTNPADRSPTR